MASGSYVPLLTCHQSTARSQAAPQIHGASCIARVQNCCNCEVARVLTPTCSFTWLSSFGTKVGLYLHGKSNKRCGGSVTYPYIHQRSDGNVDDVYSVCNNPYLSAPATCIGGGDCTVQVLAAVKWRAMSRYLSATGRSEGMHVLSGRASDSIELSESLQSAYGLPSVMPTAGCRREDTPACYPSIIIVKSCVQRRNPYSFHRIQRIEG